MSVIEINSELPFREIVEDDFEDILNQTVINSGQLENLCSKYEEFNFKNFDPAEYKQHEPGSDIDPENNFFNGTLNNCEYYTDNQFKGIKMDDTFSLIHFNSRSLNKNLKSIKDYLGKFKKFNVVAASETWLDDEKIRNGNAEMDGYELFTSNRTNTVGGGVAIYVDTAFKCSLVRNMTTNIDNLLECITVEISVENFKNIIITCVYTEHRDRVLTLSMLSWTVCLAALM